MPCSKEFFSPLSWNSLSNSSKILFITEIVVFEHRLQVIKFYSFDDRGNHLNEVVKSVCVNCLLQLQSSLVLIGVFVILLVFIGTVYMVKLAFEIERNNTNFNYKGYTGMNCTWKILMNHTGITFILWHQNNSSRSSIIEFSCCMKINFPDLFYCD